MMVGEVMAYALLHAANPKLATVVALGDRDRPAAIEQAIRHVPEKRFGNMPQARIATPKKK
jgi:hypothetical protein